MDDTQDEDGFPVANEANEGSLFTDEYEVVWVCEWSHHFQAWIWRSLGSRP